MKRLFVLSISLLCILGLSPSPTLAHFVNIYVDAAPNKNNLDPTDYEAWESSAFSAAANGSFTNMANGIKPVNSGTTDFEIEDEVVYNFGDYGKRLTFIYYVPGETKASLGSNLQVGMTNVWDGDYEDYYKDTLALGVSWLTPTKWVDYDANGDTITDGVMGTAGVAWESGNDQAAVNADMDQWMLIEEKWIFKVRLDGDEFALTAHRAPIPLPPAVILLSSGLLGLIGLRRRSRK